MYHTFPSPGRTKHINHWVGERVRDGWSAPFQVKVHHFIFFPHPTTFRRFLHHSTTRIICYITDFSFVKLRQLKADRLNFAQAMAAVVRDRSFAQQTRALLICRMLFIKRKIGMYTNVYFMTPSLVQTVQSSSQRRCLCAFPHIRAYNLLPPRVLYNWRDMKVHKVCGGLLGRREIDPKKCLCPLDPQE